MALVNAAVLADQDDYRTSGFQPEAFEVEADGSLEGVDDKAFKGLRVHGRLDRVDRRERPPGLRIVDYKYRVGPKMSGEDRDLAVAAVRGFRLQPPLYSVMQPVRAQPPHRLPETVDLVFLAPRWDPPVARSSFAAALWAEPAGRLLVQTLQTLIEGVRAGSYFILPDGYCDRCEFAAACRRFHGPTWWRAHISPQAKRLRQLRKQKVSKDRDE
jgi:ATP-dependent helicase/nuclease subunit B